MRYLSVCSGIEAATQAWHPLGWTPAAFSEIEPFPSAVLAHHYPHVPNLGDMTKHKEWDLEPIDLLVGGTPCQSFSVAGLRKGMADPRGNLALTYLAIAERNRPRWIVWENVPGVLSSNGGRDFGSFLGGMGQLGYGFAYRVLDAQFVRTCGKPFAVPQRRRRVFVVGYFGDWRRAAAVLFDRNSMSGHPAPRREAGQGVAPTISAHPTGGGGLGTDFDLDGGLIAQGVALRGREGGATAELTGPIATALRASQGGGDKPHALICANSGDVGYCLTASAQQSLDAETETLVAVAHSLRGEGFDASEDGPGRGTPLVPVSYAIQERAVSENPDNGPQGKGWQEGIGYTIEARNKVQAMAHAFPGQVGGTMGMNSHEEVSGTLVKNQTMALQQAYAVRRLTPVECERLQDFPDDFTRIPYRGKPADKCPDGPRYKALGNSMAVNVMEYIGERIHLVEDMQ